MQIIKPKKLQKGDIVVIMRIGFRVTMDAERKYFSIDERTVL